MFQVSILGCGWLGYELAKALVQEGKSVAGSVTKAEKLSQLEEINVTPYLIDWNKSWGESPFFKCDILIITVPPSTSNYKENLHKLIQYVVSAEIKKVVYTSATSVYPDNNSIVREEDAQVITSPHSGLALLDLENIVRNNAQIEHSIVRFAGLYGPDRMPGKFLAGKKNVSGANKPVNLIHREDCVEILRQLIQKDIWGHTFNACADGHPSRKEFYTKACLSQGLEPPQFNDEKGNYKIVSAEKLKRTLSYNFIHPDPLLDV